MVKRQDGGALEFLKRNHLIEPGYSSITITAEGKHASALIERFSNIDGKLPRIAFTPTSGSLTLPDSDFLPPPRAAEYRSLIGIAMYLAQERFDLQYATKTLASCLQQPAKAAWNALGRLVGYLRFSEDFGLKMEKSERGSTFMDENNALEFYSDSDWGGSGHMKSTSNAVHVMNGIVILSASRSQKCMSLSSKEAEWYAASAGVCDAYYFQHIVEFVTNGRCNILTLHTDSSAVRMLSLKFGVGRLRHIRGRILWLQQKMSNHELNIRQVPTAYSIADLNTKGLGRDRFLSLLYMIGVLNNKGEAVGEAEFLRLQAKERIKSHFKVIGPCLKDTTSIASHGVSSTSMNKTAKRVLRILSTCSLLELADGDEVSVMSPEPEVSGGLAGGTTCCEL